MENGSSRMVRLLQEKSYDSGKLLIKSTWNVTVDLVPRTEYVETKEGLNNLLLDIKKNAPKLPKIKISKIQDWLDA